ncbi:hypothetical protein LTR66_008905 [Elasticomyces elasticus]|nr:hypothetical protein LTR66_008905 [Elasticomyces elasticus]KAK4991700.1 hypothetical protein LTR50_001708 [Elasticomyces elasticus]
MDAQSGFDDRFYDPYEPTASAPPTSHAANPRMTHRTALGSSTAPRFCVGFRDDTREHRAGLRSHNDGASGIDDRFGGLSLTAGLPTTVRPRRQPIPGDLLMRVVKDQRAARERARREVQANTHKAQQPHSVSQLPPDSRYEDKSRPSRLPDTRDPRPFLIVAKDGRTKVFVPGQRHTRPFEYRPEPVVATKPEVVKTRGSEGQKASPSLSNAPLRAPVCPLPKPKPGRKIVRIVGKNGEEAWMDIPLCGRRPPPKRIDGVEPFPPLLAPQSHTPLAPLMSRPSPTPTRLAASVRDSDHDSGVGLGIGFGTPFDSKSKMPSWNLSHHTSHATASGKSTPSMPQVTSRVSSERSNKLPPVTNPASYRASTQRSTPQNLPVQSDHFPKSQRTKDNPHGTIYAAPGTITPHPLSEISAVLPNQPLLGGMTQEGPSPSYPEWKMRNHAEPALQTQNTYHGAAAESLHSSRARGNLGGAGSARVAGGAKKPSPKTTMPDNVYRDHTPRVMPSAWGTVGDGHINTTMNGLPVSVASWRGPVRANVDGGWADVVADTGVEQAW